MKIRNFIMFILVVLASNSNAQRIKAFVTAVHDGDSYKVRFTDNTTQWVRIWGCDAPEVISNHVSKHQPYGIQAGQNIRSLIKNDTIYLDTLYRDQYNRLVTKIYLKDSTDLTEYIVSTGNGWWLDDKKMPEKYLLHLKQLQSQARDSQIGFWSLSGVKNRPSYWRNKYRRVTKN